jgi:hypothetical protein
MPTTIKPVSQLMRAFDDTTALANILQPTVLVTPIMDLQNTRRELENMDLPDCLGVLQKSGVSYMNSVINYLGMFLAVSGTQNQISADNQKIVSSAVAASQNLRIAYEKEHARLLGETYQPPATVTPGVTTTPASPTPGSAETQNSFTVTNSSTLDVNLRSDPVLTGSTVVGTLPPSATATAIARTALSDWILVSYGQLQGWVYTSLVQVNGALESLPVFGQP